MDEINPYPYPETYPRLRNVCIEFECLLYYAIIMSDTESISSASVVNSKIEDSESDDGESRYMLAYEAPNRRSRSKASTHK